MGLGGMHGNAEIQRERLPFREGYSLNPVSTR